MSCYQMPARQIIIAILLTDTRGFKLITIHILAFQVLPVNSLHFRNLEHNSSNSVPHAAVTITVLCTVLEPSIHEVSFWCLCVFGALAEGCCTIVHLHVT